MKCWSGWKSIYKVETCLCVIMYAACAVEPDFRHRRCHGALVAPDSSFERLSPCLRAIRLSDAEALCTILACPGLRRGTLRIPFETVESWEKRIAKSGAESTWIVAEVEGKVVGHGNLTVQSAPRRAHIGEIVIGVDDGFVGRGIGAAILAALLDVADNWRDSSG